MARISSCLMVIALLFLHGKMISQTTIREGEVWGEWTNNSSPYIIEGNIIVPAGKKLSIQAGTKVRFSKPCNLVVRGSIFARGEETKPITITFIDSTSKNSVTAGKGIKIYGTPSRKDTALFTWCIFSNGNATGEKIDKCRGGAIFADSCRYIKISRCTFFRNSAVAGGAIYVRNSNLQVDGCRFEENKSLTDGGAMCLVRCKARINNNIFFYNNAYSMGGALMVQNMKSLFANNLIVENSGRFGAGIALVNDTSSFINNTIANNSSTYNGGGIHMEKSNTRFINSILWGNLSGKDGKQGYLFADAAPRFWFCNLQDGTMAIKSFKASAVAEDFNNIDLNPVFADKDTARYILAEGSPCIDYGIPDTSSLYIPKTDLAYRKRINGNKIDMGAYEYGVSYSDEDDEPWLENVKHNDERPKLKLTAYPNPSSGYFKVLVSNPEHKSLMLHIASSRGNVMIESPILNTDEVFILPVEVTGKPGVYILSVTDENNKKLKEKKVVVN